MVQGKDFQRQHRNVIFEYGGHLPDLLMRNTGTCYALQAAYTEEPAFFPNITSIFKPIARKSSCFSKENQKFIYIEINF